MQLFCQIWYFNSSSSSRNFLRKQPKIFVNLSVGKSLTIFISLWTLQSLQQQNKYLRLFRFFLVAKPGDWQISSYSQVSLLLFYSLRLSDRKGYINKEFLTKTCTGRLWSPDKILECRRQETWISRFYSVRDKSVETWITINISFKCSLIQCIFSDIDENKN